MEECHQDAPGGARAGGAGEAAVGPTGWGGGRGEATRPRDRAGGGGGDTPSWLQ